MSLLELAEQDLALTLENPDDFGRQITLTDPSGNSGTPYGQFGDISQLIELDDTSIVSQRVIHISLRLSTLAALGLDYPETQQEDGANPWEITVTNIRGVTNTYKLQMTKPDRTLGLVTALVTDLEDA